jgi:hypothetical protein
MDRTLNGAETAHTQVAQQTWRSNDGAGQWRWSRSGSVLWAKGKVSSAPAGAVRAQARDRQRLGEAGGLNAVAAAPRVVYSCDEDEISEFRARSAALVRRRQWHWLRQGLAQNAIGLTKGYAAARLEYPTFSSERAARLKTTQAGRGKLVNANAGKWWTKS